ncbi:unnamed protein product [Ilex paraguariensis]|uniref:Morc S5 domain-containing protein n=1 Tax=Ilex paraguariensis TaxID=185542 RepID=A0ABC8SX58_9AQUA
MTQNTVPKLQYEVLISLSLYKSIPEAFTCTSTNTHTDIPPNLPVYLLASSTWVILATPIDWPMICFCDPTTQWHFIVSLFWASIWRSTVEPLCFTIWKNGKNYLCVHPMYLHSNATSHKWAFGAIAELLDNAVDEIQNGATYVQIEKIINPRDGSLALLLQDDGGGMDPEAIRQCMSFGFSEKKMKSAIGQYGNGFKTSSMRLGADVIVFTRHLEKRKVTQSIGLLSYTFLRKTSHDRVVVPLVDYELDASTRKLGHIYPHGKQFFSANLSVLLQWSPYSTEEMLLKQFDDIGTHGTKIVIYNLWLNGDGDMELDFDIDTEDIRINADAKLLQTGHHPRLVCDQHIANLYRYSLRAYASILYLRLPQSFRIILRGRVVEHHNIADDLKFPEFILYRPQLGGNMEAAVVTTIGFLRDAPHVNIHGLNIYHRNRLIMPFWRVVKDTTNSNARGVVGVLEANFIEPTHNKQDFEKTSLFQKLEARLKEMTMEYWHFHCGLIGYQQMKKSSPATEPLSSRPRSHVEQPVLLNQTSSLVDRPRPVSSTVDSVEDDENTVPNLSCRSLEQTIYDNHIRPRQGLRTKRKKRKATLEPEHGKSCPGSGSYGTDTMHNAVEQPSGCHETMVRDEETMSLMQENEKLKSKLLELQRREENLNLKVQQLRRELGDVQGEYARLLAESEGMGI